MIHLVVPGMKILKLNNNNEQNIIEEAIAVLRAGGLVVYPTETCYGIGADITNSLAIEKLFKYKSRREGKPLSIAVTDKKMAIEYVELNDIAHNLYDNYLPGPITVVSKSLGKVTKGVESELGTIGIRIPQYPLVLDLVRKFGKPITSTSANVSYNPRPYSIEKLLEETPKKSTELIDFIIDAGELPYNEPSTVVDTTLNNLNIMREGGLHLKNLIKNRKAVLSAHTYSVDETINFGALNMLKFLDVPRNGILVFLLNGELGAGKTHFTKGIAKELGIKNVIKSPTYVILNEYKYELGDRKGLLVHVDNWRIENSESLTGLGLAEYMKLGNIIVVEWADKFYQDTVKLFKKKNVILVNVLFKHINEEEREISTYLV